MYTKLFQSIVTSTIWTEDDKTRLVWITLLALSDQHGEVAGSIPGLARLASVSVEDCEKALHKLKSPDPYSRTTDYEGRRIEDIDGGWALLNHEKYRKMASKEDRKEKAAIRQRRCRDRKRSDAACHATVTQSHAFDHDSHAMSRACHATVTQQRDIAEAEAEAEENTSSPLRTKNQYLFTEGQEKNESAKSKKAAPPALRLSGFDEFWKAYPRKTGKGLAEKAWEKVNPPLPDVLAALEWQRNQLAWTKDHGQFIPMPATYINQKRWLDEPAGPVRDAMAEF